MLWINVVTSKFYKYTSPIIRNVAKWLYFWHCYLTYIVPHLKILCKKNLVFHAWWILMLHPFPLSPVEVWRVALKTALNHTQFIGQSCGGHLAQGCFEMHACTIPPIVWRNLAAYRHSRNWDGDQSILYLPKIYECIGIENILQTIILVALQSWSCIGKKYRYMYSTDIHGKTIAVFGQLGALQGRWGYSQM